MSITIEWKQRGQPRPYADSVYSGVVSGGTEEEAKVALSKARGTQGSIKMSTENPAWWEPRFVEFTPIAPNTWRFKIIEPYTD